jgi:hypothetical protein
MTSGRISSLTNLSGSILLKKDLCSVMKNKKQRMKPILSRLILPELPSRTVAKGGGLS